MVKVGKELYDLIDAEENRRYAANSAREAAVHAARDTVEPVLAATLLPEGEGYFSEDTPYVGRRAKAYQEAREEIKILHRGSGNVFVYDAWTWEERAPEGAPDWLPDSRTAANVERTDVHRPSE